MSRSREPTSWSEGTLRPRVDVVDLVVAVVEHAGGVHPPLDVPAAIDARHPHMLADRKRHRAARAVDLVGELDAGRRRADDEHAARLELIGVAILHRRQHRDRRPAPPRQAAGTVAMLQAPVASTTVRHRQSPRSADDAIALVGSARTDVTVGAGPDRRRDRARIARR